MEKLLLQFKNKSKNRKSFINSGILTKILLSIILFLVSTIFIKYSDNNLLLYKEIVFNKNLDFSKIKKTYENLFGSVLPINEKVNEQMVFGGKINYKEINDYYDGEKLKVSNNTVVSNIQSGIVVFIGNKDNFNNTVIIQGIDGVDIWYGNLQNVNVKLYDYLEKETILGETVSDELYLVIKKDKEYISYENYQV